MMAEALNSKRRKPWVIQGKTDISVCRREIHWNLTKIQLDVMDAEAIQLLNDQLAAVYSPNRMAVV